MAEEGKGVGAGTTVALVLGVGCLGVAVLVAVIGVLAAIAIPAFIGYTKRSKTAEASSNLEALYVGVSSYAAEHGQLPPESLPRTPFAPSCERTLWPSEADPRWSELGFGPADPIYYSYEYVVDPLAGTFSLRAHGDLDCDGVESMHELTGGIDEGGQTYRSPGIFVQNELE